MAGAHVRQTCTPIGAGLLSRALVGYWFGRCPGEELRTSFAATSAKLREALAMNCGRQVDAGAGGVARAELNDLSAEVRGQY
jgi:hypothetical protein